MKHERRSIDMGVLPIPGTISSETPLKPSGFAVIISQIDEINARIANNSHQPESVSRLGIEKDAFIIEKVLSAALEAKMIDGGYTVGFKTDDSGSKIKLNVRQRNENRHVEIVKTYYLPFTRNGRSPEHQSQVDRGIEIIGKRN